MDPLTHIFLPLTVAYVLRRDLFSRPRYLAVGLFGLVPDLDKLVGIPGLFHSLVTLVPLCLALVAFDRWYRRGTGYGLLASGFVLSHLVLDIIEGVTVPLLFPLVTTGIGLAYPGTVIFGPEASPLWVAFDGLPITVEFGELRTGHAADAAVGQNTFGFLDGFGVASTLTFLLISVGRRYQEQDESGEEPR
ncbi:MAG: metal-dependent hydrolase [Halovenus sp.]